jgi:protein subunit release factor A
VRVTHLPTGLTADVHHGRSLRHSHELALRLLAGRLFVARAGLARRPPFVVD